MGIEPTDHMISMRPSDFEDRGLHQQSKHFHYHLPARVYLRLPNLATSSIAKIWWWRCRAIAINIAVSQNRTIKFTDMST